MPTMNSATEIVPISPRKIVGAGDVLARAFYNDPLFTYLLPDESSRMTPLGWLVRGCIRCAHLYGEAYTMRNLEAVSLWLTPESPPMNPWRILRAGLAFAPFSSRPAPFRRLVQDIRHMGDRHSRDSPEPHWYLWFLGVDPQLQGRGFGSALLRLVLSGADIAAMPCYLDTFEPRNLRFYEGHGFKVVGESDIPIGGPHYWTMKRTPRHQTGIVAGAELTPNLVAACDAIREMEENGRRG